MNNKPDNLRNSSAGTKPVHPLKTLSAPEFAALGGDRMVFVRSIRAELLAGFVPEAKAMPDDMVFQLIMGADGNPLLVADNEQAIADWLSEADVVRVLRH